MKNYHNFINQKVNEEAGMRNIKSIVEGYQDFEIWLHQDLDGVFSALCMRKYIEDYGLTLVDTHIIQYGGIEFAVKNKQKD